MIKEITSISNPTVKFTTSLKNKKDCIANDLCFVEGEKIIMDMLTKGYTPNRLFIEESKLEKYSDLTTKYENITYKVSQAVAKKLSDTVTNPGIFGLFNLPKQKPFDYKSKFLIIEAILPI